MGCGAVEITVTVDAGRVTTLIEDVVVVVVVVVRSMAEDERVEVGEGARAVDEDVSAEAGRLVGDELEGEGGADNELLVALDVDLVEYVRLSVLGTAGNVAGSVEVEGSEVG